LTKKGNNRVKGRQEKKLLRRQEGAEYVCFGSCSNDKKGRGRAEVGKRSLESVFYKGLDISGGKEERKDSEETSAVGGKN